MCTCVILERQQNTLQKYHASFFAFLNDNRNCMYMYYYADFHQRLWHGYTLHQFYSIYMISTFISLIQNYYCVVVIPTLSF